MDIKIRCPHCETKLVVGDELVGQAVLCEDCNRQFTVEAPAATTSKSDEQPRSRRPADEDQPRRSRDDFDDDRPARRRPKRGGGHLAPILFGSLLLLTTLGVAVGLFFAFGFHTGSYRSAAGGTNNPFVPPAGGNLYRVADARWVGPNTFTVAVETTTGRPDPTPMRVAYRSTDGQSNFVPFTLFGSARQSVTVPRIGPFRAPTTVWVEPAAGGASVSNTFQLN